MEVELTLKQKLLHEINIRSKVFVAELVRISGYSNLQNFKRCLTSDREFDKFQGLLDVVEYIWPDKVVEIISQYSTEIDPSRKTARLLLEWLSSNKQLSHFKSLIDRMECCNNKESREWSVVYAIQYHCQSQYPNVNLDEVIQSCKFIKTNISELKTFLKLIKTYVHHQRLNFYMTRLLADEVKYYLDEVDNEYIKNAYTIRISEIMSWVELRVYNQPEKAREYIDNILQSNVGKPFKAYANFQKGYSYIFTSYEKSVEYLSESLRLYKEYEKRDWVFKDLEEKLEFIDILWDKQKDDGCKYIKNYLLYHIKKGVNVSKALEESKETINDEPFYLYLKGLAEKDAEILVHSVIKYVKKGDSFLANLAKREAVNLGLKEYLLEDMLNIRVH